MPHENRDKAHRSAAISVVVGVVVLGLKFLAWRLTGSVALYSDALESIVNVVAALVAFSALRIAARPADHDHPWGHDKAEYFSAGAEGSLIVVAAGTIIWAAVGRLGSPPPVEALGIGAMVSGGASLLNGVLGWWLVRRGRELGSPAVEADGAHVLSDVFTTGGVLLGLAVARSTGLWILDPLIAIAVALHIVLAGWKILRASIGGLMDEAVAPHFRTRLDEVIRGSMDGAIEYHAMRARRAGARTFVEFHLVVPGDMTVADSHALCDRIEAAVQGVIEGADVTIHVEPETERDPGTSGTPPASA